MTSARRSEQARGAVPLETAQPLADSRRGGGKEPSRRLDAALAGAFDQTQAMVVGVVFHLTDQSEVASGKHGPRIVGAMPAQRRRLRKRRSLEKYRPLFQRAWESRRRSEIPTFPATTAAIISPARPTAKPSPCAPSDSSISIQPADTMCPALPPLSRLR